VPHHLYVLAVARNATTKWRPTPTHAPNYGWSTEALAIAGGYHSIARQYPLNVATRQAWIAAAGGAGRRSAKNALAPMNQSREAHLTAQPLHSPSGGPASRDAAVQPARGTHPRGRRD
jgi:hypothetical protein